MSPADDLVVYSSADDQHPTVDAEIGRFDGKAYLARWCTAHRRFRFECDLLDRPVIYDLDNPVAQPEGKRDWVMQSTVPAFGESYNLTRISGVSS